MPIIKEDIIIIFIIKYKNQFNNIIKLFNVILNMQMLIIIEELSTIKKNKIFKKLLLIITKLFYTILIMPVPIIIEVLFILIKWKIILKQCLIIAKQFYVILNLLKFTTIGDYFIMI